MIDGKAIPQQKDMHGWIRAYSLNAHTHYM